MSQLLVALLQMTACSDDQRANLEKGDSYCRRASAMGADLALFPEMWNVGYTQYHGAPNDLSEIGAETSEQRQSRADWQARAISDDGAFVAHFRELAHELNMAIVLTYLEEWSGAPRNTAVVIDRHGEIVLTYAKVHTCDFSLEAACTPGDDFHVAELDTECGPVQVGVMICYDREFPESARILMLKGAEIILTPNACELEENRIAQFRTRAFENMVGVAMTNYAAPQHNGHSVAYDGMVCHANGRMRDMKIVEAGESEGTYLASFDLDALRAYRQQETWGNAFRRPHRYELLTSCDVEPPFVRTDAGGNRYDRFRR